MSADARVVKPVGDGIDERLVQQIHAVADRAGVTQIARPPRDARGGCVFGVEAAGDRDDRGQRCKREEEGLEPGGGAGEDNRYREKPDGDAREGQRLAVEKGLGHGGADRPTEPVGEGRLDEEGWRGRSVERDTNGGPRAQAQLDHRGDDQCPRPAQRASHHEKKRIEQIDLHLDGNAPERAVDAVQSALPAVVNEKEMREELAVIDHLAGGEEVGAEKNALQDESDAIRRVNTKEAPGEEGQPVLARRAAVGEVDAKSANGKKDRYGRGAEE